MRKFGKVFIIIVLVMAMFALTSCTTTPQSYDIDAFYFDDITFERQIATDVSFEGDVGTTTGHSYYISLTTKCIVPLYEYTVVANFYDNNHRSLYGYEKTFKKNKDANEAIVIDCEVPYDIYVAVESVDAEITGKSYVDPNEGAKSIKNPIDSISFNYESQAITLGSTIEIEPTLYPTNTDDTLIWKSSNSNVATVNNGVIKTVGAGTVIISAKARYGTKYQDINLKVMPNKDSTDINNCKAISNSSIVTIENKCYNASGSTSESKVFSGVIFKKVGNTCYFVTGYSNFNKISGYNYQSWTVTDCNGKKYNLSNIKHEQDYSLGNDYKLAIGSIEASNLSALEVSPRIKYFKNERIYIKRGGSFVESSILETTTSSPVATELQYRDDLYGSLILDCEFNFIGIGIRKNVVTGGLDFVNSNFIQKLIDLCDI